MALPSVGEYHPVPREPGESRGEGRSGGGSACFPASLCSWDTASTPLLGPQAPQVLKPSYSHHRLSWVLGRFSASMTP